MSLDFILENLKNFIFSNSTSNRKTNYEFYMDSDRNISEIVHLGRRKVIIF